MSIKRGDAMFDMFVCRDYSEKKSDWWTKSQFFGELKFLLQFCFNFSHLISKNVIFSEQFLIYYRRGRKFTLYKFFIM